MYKGKSCIDLRVLIQFLMQGVFVMFTSFCLFFVFQRPIFEDIKSGLLAKNIAAATLAVLALVCEAISDKQL